MGRGQITLKSTCRKSHFTWDERLKLQYYWLGTNKYAKIQSYTLLGKIFQKSAKTIKREIRRGMVMHTRSDAPFERWEYNAEHAQLDAEVKMSAKGPQSKSGRHHALVERIAKLIGKDHYSPYAVIKRLDEKKAWPEGVRICEKTLYNWIEAGDIPEVTIKDLPRKGSMKRRKGSGRPKKHSKAEFAARSIDKRPREISEPLTAGHWEGDTVYSTKNGSKECLLTLVERKTRVVIIRKIKDRTAVSVVKAINKLERELGSKQFKEIFLSITFDNGSEFADVKALEMSCLTKQKRTSLYFAHPYCSSERGTNENHNGIIRRFLPKGTDFATVKDKKVKEVQNWMNTYPRKILEGETPLQAFIKKFNLEDHSIQILKACS